jgi:hypothetical protein
VKPHIKLVRKGLWSCTGESIIRNGVSPRQAYDRWHAAAGKTVQAAVTQVFKLPPPRVATPMTVRPDHIEATSGAALLGYSESMVRRVAGTVPSAAICAAEGTAYQSSPGGCPSAPDDVHLKPCRRLALMFHSPEEALAVAFTITELPIEPKNATQLIVEALRERHGLEMRRPPSGLTPHDWHVQAVMVLKFAERTLASRPDLWRAILAEYSPRIDGALAIQAVANELVPGLNAEERVLADMLVMRQFRRKPALEDIAGRFGVSRQTVGRRERFWREQIGQLRRAAMQCLEDPMRQAGLLEKSSANAA